MRFVKDMLRKLGINVRMSVKDIEDMLKLSLRNFERNRMDSESASVDPETGDASFSIRTYEEEGRDKLGRFVDRGGQRETDSGAGARDCG